VSNRVYQGIRNHMGIPEVYVLENTRRRTLKDQLVLLYEPLEFDWGYKGKEPRNLSIALLADALEGGDDPNVDRLFHRLTDETISVLPADGWQITQSDLLAWVYGKLDRIPVHPLPLEAIGGGVPGSLN
jgi:hypothetical protein